MPTNPQPQARDEMPCPGCCDCCGDGAWYTLEDGDHLCNGTGIVVRQWSGEEE